MMPINIPAERLALLETATLYAGAHSAASGGPGCKHCARELIHEIATGKHADANPPGSTIMGVILPPLNDGPWRDDAHRTQIVRPYLRHFLPPPFGLDPAKDEQRIYAVIDHVYREIVPDICDALRLDKHSAALRDLAPIVDRDSTLAALDALAELAKLNALGALDMRAARTARTALNALAAYEAFDTLAALAARAAFDALDTLAALDTRADYWERGTVAILDRICAI